jgi:hypothetical protein
MSTPAAELPRDGYEGMPRDIILLSSVMPDLLLREELFLFSGADLVVFVGFLLIF